MAGRRSVCILGSTGSIGTQALDVIRRNPQLFRVVALSSTGRNRDLFMRQIEEFKPHTVASLVKVDLPEGVRGIFGDDANVRLVKEVEADIYLVALSGTSGIFPTYMAVERGTRVALANKESLVSAGYFITRRAKDAGTELIPVDSEHSAIYQCVMRQDLSAIRRIVLTASGGPFLRLPVEDLDRVTPDDALSHPKWDMGPKVTVDSATMMNKGFEVIEARWLFDVNKERIEVVVHPEAVVHSMVEFTDGAIVAQMGCADMRIPISFALGFPKRIESGAPFLDLSALRLTFEPPDPERFPLLSLAYWALEKEKVWPVVINAADEVAVWAFLKGVIGFRDIHRVVLSAVERFADEEVLSIEDVEELQKRVFAYTQKVVRRIAEGL